MTGARVYEAPPYWACERTIGPVIATNWWRDDTLNEDGTKPEGWQSAEEKALQDAGPGGGCC